ncbi:MAG: hypothetical protein D4R45_01160 [Planctomycetaceae bacterium]|nr:MAG: hypothetical protein D4R45_01160 [Planctomycetaceae bacterium]
MLYNIIIAVSYNILCLVAASGTGLFCLRIFNIRLEGVLQRLLFATGIGFALISNILLAVGLAGMLNRSMALAILLIALIIAIIQLPLELRRLGYDGFRFPGSYLVWAIIGLLSLHIILNLIGSFAPPSLADSMRHHLAAPKYYAQVGGFPFVPIMPWPMPGLLHVLYTQALLLTNGLAPQVLACMFGILTMLAVFAFISRYFGTLAGMFGAAIFYTLPMTTELSTGAMVELGATFFAVLGVWALMETGPKLESRWIVLAGLLGGCAGATKVWALVGGPAAIMVIIFLAGRRVLKQPHHVFYAIFIYSLSYGAVLSPWFIRNFVAAGDPLWPLGYGFFNTQYFSAVKALKMSGWHRGPGSDLWYYLIGPWSLTNNIVSFAGSYGVLTHGVLSPVLLAFIPAAWLFRKNVQYESKRTVSAIGVFCLVVYTIWFLGGYQHPRYIQLLHPFLAILAGVGVAAFLNHCRGYLHKLTYAIVCVVFVPMLMFGLALNFKYFPVVFGFVSQDNYLEGKQSYYSGIQWVNRNLPKEAKVLYAGSCGWYYLERDYITLSYRYIDWNNLKTPEELKQELTSRGITHILVESDDSGRARLREYRKEVRHYKFNEPGDYQKWLDAKPEDLSLGIITYYEIRPIILMAALEAKRDLSLVKVIPTKIILSRTKGTSVDSEFAVYSLK